VKALAISDIVNVARTTLLFVLCSMITGTEVRAENPQSTVLPQAKLKPFLQTYCVRCHGPEKQNGQVRFDRIAWEITNNDSAQRWQDVLDILNAGDMPPKDEKQPGNDELARVLDTLTGSLVTARKRLTDHGGEITMRRLNRREYANTIRHLFGLNLSEDSIPEDQETDLFDTVGADQFFSSSDFENYLELGRKVATSGIGVSSQPRREPHARSRVEPEERVTPRMRMALADLDNKMRMKKEGKTWQEMGFKDEGEAQIIFRQFDTRAGHRREYLELPLVGSGVYLAESPNTTNRCGANLGTDPRATYRLRVRTGIVGNPPGIRRFLRVTDKVGTIGTLQVRGTATEPEIIELTVAARMESRVTSVQVQENRADIRVKDQYVSRIDKGGQRASIWIDWVELEGPYYPDERSFFERLLYPDGFVRGRPPLMTDERGRDLIQQFAFEAFRRQRPGDRFVDQLFELFTANRSEGQTHAQAMSEVFGIILSSPAFLYLNEGSSGKAKRQTLSDRELAIRLAYFLWSAPPDDELYAAARNGQLSNPDALHQQVDRMLNDSKAQSFYEGFIGQWAELDRFDAITVDPLKYFRFNEGIRLAARREVSEFFKTLVAKNLSVSNLVDSDFVTVNAVLAEHYGIEGVESDEFQKVSLPADSPRGGLLTQTAFLVAGSNGERSSPVIRGALVMEKLLHDKPAPPPPNVPELGAASKTPATNRQMVELHQHRAVCASCHKKMDVIGFGLENFDPIGKWRDTEKVGRKNVPIEPGGTLPDGSRFDDVPGLKRVLMKQKSAVAREVLVSLLAYGVGRSIEFSDSDRVEEIVKRLDKNDFGVRSMIHEVVASKLFQMK
jgi:hypothetical protein